MHISDEQIASSRTHSEIPPARIRCDGPNPLFQVYGVREYEAIATEIIRASQRNDVWLGLSLTSYGRSKMEMVRDGWLAERLVQGISIFELTERSITRIYYRQSSACLQRLEQSLATMTAREHFVAAWRKIFSSLRR